MHLYFFTNSFPYGIGELWKESELQQFSKDFQEVNVSPLFYNGEQQPMVLPAKIKVSAPLRRDENFFNNFSIGRLKILLNPRFFYYLQEFIVMGVFRNKAWVISWLNAVWNTEALLSSKLYQELQDIEKKEEVVLYFFWGLGFSFLVPFLVGQGFNKIVVRFHGYDLYRSRNRGYIPFRSALLSSLDIALTVSDMGKEYLADYPGSKELNVKTFRLGSKSYGRSEASTDGTLRIMTCSGLVPLKRISLICEALEQLEFLIEWTHLGDGELMNELKRWEESKPKNITTRFPGWVKSESVHTFYSEKKVDLFLNVSTTEGVPVAAMEALAAGVPVMATDVGGTKEIIDDQVGKLLPAELTKEQLAKSIGSFFELSDAQKDEMRAHAFERFADLCNAETNAAKVSNMLLV